MWIKKQDGFSKNKLFSSSQQFSVYLLAQIDAQKINFSVTNILSKYEHICRKLRICSYLLNKSLTENVIFCVFNIIGFTTESCKFFFKPNCQSLIYFTSINTWLVSSLLFRYQFLVLGVINSTFTDWCLRF